MPGNIGWTGAVVIILVLLLVFGPKRLPEMGRSLGRGMREFKDSISGNKTADEPVELSAADDRGAGFCSSCRTPLAVGAQFCASCGTPVTSSANGPTEAPRETATIDHDS